MDGLSNAASIIAVIQLTGNIATICGGYIGAVKNAEKDIKSLQKTVEDFMVVLNGLSDLLKGLDGGKLSTSRKLDSPISECLSELKALEERLRPREKWKIMRVLGRLLRLRALKWPLESKEIEKVINNLERYKGLFSLTLQVDQTSVVYPQ
jgi:hypothetical protein